MVRTGQEMTVAAIPGTQAEAWKREQVRRWIVVTLPSQSDNAGVQARRPADKITGDSRGSRTRGQPPGKVLRTGKRACQLS